MKRRLTPPSILLIAVLGIAATLQAAPNNGKTFSIVVNPKIINDFTDPLPSIQAFYDNYQSVMSPYAEQLIVFYAGAADYIYRYPSNAFATPPVATANVYNGSPISFDPLAGGAFNDANAQQDPNDRPPGVASPSYRVSVNGPSGLQVTARQLFQPGQGILLRNFPMMKWSWKKNGGSTLIIQFLLNNRSVPIGQPPQQLWVGYYEGTLPPGSGIGTWAQFNLGPAAATAWETKKVNLWADFSTVNDRSPWSLNPFQPFSFDLVYQDWEVIGIALTPYDGVSASFDQIEASNDAGIMWARNTRDLDFSRNTEWLNQTGRIYPQELTYSELRTIFQTFKQEGQRRGLNVQIFDGVDPGFEFAMQEWKFRMHPEVKDPILFNITLNPDTYSYRAYPSGIPPGTKSGDFIAHQIGAYVADMNLDGIYSTNGYGTFPEGNPRANNCVYDPALAQSTLAFLKNMKTQLGTKKHFWMDTYLSPDLSQRCWSLPIDAYQYFDYVQISNFFQNFNIASHPMMVGPWILGPDTHPTALNEVLNWPGHTGEQYMTEDIVGQLAVKPSFPQVKILWTYYYEDPWYWGVANSYAQLYYQAPYVDQLDGITLYSNDYRGNNLPPAWITPLSTIFPTQASASPPIVTACAPPINPCPTQTVTMPASASLNGTASDSDPNATLTYLWSKINYSGPASAPPSSNVALAANGATAMASSELAGYPAASAITGNRTGIGWGGGTGGWNDSTPGAFADSLQINFAGTKIISEIDVYTLQDNYGSPVVPSGSMTFSQYGITDFNVQYYNGTTWLDVPNGHITNNHLVWRQLTFPAVSTNKIRIMVNNALNSSSRIVDVEAYSYVNGAPGKVLFGAPDQLSTTANFSDPGSYVLTLIASDGTLTSTSDVSVIINGPPNLVLTKSADLVTAQANEVVTYTVQYHNTGSGDAVNAVISDPIPVGTTLVPGSISNGGINNAGTIQWTIATVPAGGSGTMTFQVKMN